VRVDILRFLNNTFTHIVINKTKDITFITDIPKNIKNPYITFTPNDLIIKSVKINASVKESLIPSVIKAKLSKEIQDDFIFYYELEDKEENQNSYKVEVILKKEILNILNEIQNKNIKLITTDFHSLFEISKKYFDDEFISIFLTKENIIYICGKETLKFFRAIPTPENEEEISNDINRTIIYFKQQLKNLNLNNVLISGDTEIINNIYDKINAPLSQPLPIGVKNISSEKFNSYFLLFGVLFSKANFLPDEIKTYKIFNYIFILISFILTSITIYEGYNTYRLYNESLNKQTILYYKKAKLLKLKENTKLLKSDILDYYLTYIKLKKESYKSIFLKDLQKLKPIFNIIAPTSVYVHKNIRIEFDKKFSSFKKLIKEKNTLEELLKKLNLKYDIHTDFQHKSLKLIILIKREQ
jgi:hypothetical protein